jgi:hypothetical protein
MSTHAQRTKWREITLRGHRISRPPPSPTSPPRVGQEIVNWRGTAWTWNGRSWTAPEAQIGLLGGDVIGGPRIFRPADDFPASNVPASDGDLFWDKIGLQLYCWHDDGTTASWVVVGNSGTGTVDIWTDASIAGNGAQATPLSVAVVDGSVY